MSNPHICVDVESDGAIIGSHSMIAIGMVIVEPGFERTFKGLLRPVSVEWEPEALAVSGYSREDVMEFPPAEETMVLAAQWIYENVKGTPILWSDNNGYDKSWMHNYFLRFNGGIDPFGHSSRRIADFICGIEKDLRFKWKNQRITKHTHDPVDDAKGNAEVLLKYFEQNNIKYRK